MAARITRAKKKIALARIPCGVPSPAELPERVEAVLSVVHLDFTTGHTTPTGPDLLRRDLVERAVCSCVACCAGCCPATRRWPVCWRCCS